MKRLALVALALVLAGCGQDYKESQGINDAPIARTDNAGWVVLSAPDQFPNIAFRCMGPNGIYNPRLASKDSARTITVVPNDPQCAK